MEKFYNVEEQKYWNNVDIWTQGGHEWSGQFGTTENLWNKYLFDDLKEFRNKNILEIAPGHGRITQFLSILAKELVVVDLNPTCIEKTKEKMGHHVQEYIVCDGKSLPNVGDETQDLVFSYDSFVHMHQNVIDEYLSEISRVLVFGGKGIIHHSCLLGGNDYSFNNYGGRSNMNGEIFKEIVEKHNMRIINQKPIKISEGNEVWTAFDIISIFEKNEI